MTSDLYICRRTTFEAFGQPIQHMYEPIAPYVPQDEKLDHVQAAIILTHLDKMKVPEWMMKVIGNVFDKACNPLYLLDAPKILEGG